MCLREKIGPDPRNFNQRVSLGRHDLLIRTFLSGTAGTAEDLNLKDGMDVKLHHVHVDASDACIRIAEILSDFPTFVEGSADTQDKLILQHSSSSLTHWGEIVKQLSGRLKAIQTPFG
nr:Uncharacterised protein [Escherichia coli]